MPCRGNRQHRIGWCRRRVRYVQWQAPNQEPSNSCRVSVSQPAGSALNQVAWDNEPQRRELHPLQVASGVKFGGFLLLDGPVGGDAFASSCFLYSSNGTSPGRGFCGLCCRQWFCVRRIWSPWCCLVMPKLSLHALLGEPSTLSLVQCAPRAVDTGDRAATSP